MHSRFRFTYEKDWRQAPMAYWVHIQNENGEDTYTPPAPRHIPHKGYVYLRVEYGLHELVFSSPEQLEHCIEVLATKPLPTTRTLSARRGSGAGPNQHWLSRLPAELKPPPARSLLVRHLKAVYAMAVAGTPVRKGRPSASPLWPGLAASSNGAA